MAQGRLARDAPGIREFARRSRPPSICEEIRRVWLIAPITETARDTPGRPQSYPGASRGSHLRPRSPNFRSATMSRFRNIMRQACALRKSLTCGPCRRSGRFGPPDAGSKPPDSGAKSTDFAAQMLPMGALPGARRRSGNSAHGPIFPDRSSLPGPRFVEILRIAPYFRSQSRCHFPERLERGFRGSR
jgi:hypothetical protein